MAGQLQLELPREIGAPALARGALDALAPQLDADELVDLKVVIGELLTNAVKYGGEGPVKLILELDGDRIRGEVVDQGDGFEPAPRDPEAVGGWGLELVETLTDRWGHHEGSTHVWFEMARGDAAAERYRSRLDEGQRRRREVQDRASWHGQKSA